MKQGNISTGQLVILLFISRCFNMLNYVPALSEPIEYSAVLAGNVLSLFIQAALLIPPLLLFRRFDGESAITVAYDRWKPLGWLYSLLYLIAVLTQLAGTLAGFEYFMINAAYPGASAVFIIVSMALACFWCGRHGLEGITRASAIVFVFLLLSTGFICAISLRSLDIYNFHPLLSDPARSIGKAALQNLSKSPELYLMILLYPKIKGSVLKCSFGLIVASFLMVEITGTVLVGVLGEYGFTQTFPYYTLASVSDTELLQRLDSLHMLNWVFSAFVRCTILVIIGNECARTALPAKVHRFILPVLFLIAAGLAIAASYSTETLGELNRKSSLGIGTAVLIGGLPLLLLLITKRRKEDAPKEETYTVLTGSD